MASILGVCLAGFSSSCGTTPTPASSTSPKTTPTVAASPTPDATTLKYVALIKSYWIQVLAADEATSTTNVAALVCLGKVSPAAPNELQFVDPKKCHARMVVSLSVHERFLAVIKAAKAPPQFAWDDQVFRAQLPKGIAHVKTLIAVTTNGSKEAVLQAAITYDNDFFPIVTNALDDVDPSVVHN